MKLINEIKAGGLTTTISPHDFKTTLAKFNSLVSLQDQLNYYIVCWH
jgi:ABC-type Mn2+/Zn2+ transport system ATPase subunit